MIFIKIYFMINIVLCIITLCFVYRYGNNKIFGMTNFNKYLLIEVITILLIGLPYDIIFASLYLLGNKNVKEKYEEANKYYDIDDK